MTNIVYNKNGIPFDIDAIATDLNGKMDRDGINATASVCVESYVNGRSWYRVYSDGWCEQGGLITGVSDAELTVSLLKNFSSTNYSVTICRGGNTNSSYSNSPAGMATYSAWSLTTSSFGTWGIANGIPTFMWEAKGYIR